MPRLSPPRSKRVQVEEPKPGEATLAEEEVVIEFSDDDLDGLVVETPQDPPQEPVEPEPPAEPDPDEVVRRAVEAQQRAEELARTAQRERDEARRQAQEQQEQLSRERTDREDAEYNGILTSMAAEQATLDRAEAEYAALLQAGEYTAAAKAQTVISKATARLDRLEDNKASFDQKRATQKDQPPKPPEQPRATPTVEQQIDAYQVPDSAKEWLRKHPQFVTDPSQTQRLGAVHGYLTTVRNIAQFTPAYFEALESDLGLKTTPAPAAPVQPQQPQQRRSMPVTAPVSRDVPTPSGQRQTSSQVTLTPEEVQIARTSYTDPSGKMTNADKERAYALNKLKLQRMRANGEYPSRERA